MKGLQINFQLKRQTKLGKIMTYLLVVAVFILAMAFCVYVPYVGKVKERNDAMLAYADAKNEFNQLQNESADRTVNDNASKQYKSDYEGLCASLGTTKLTYTVDGEEIEFDGLEEEVGYYTSVQDKIEYILNAVNEFNSVYEEAGILAKIEEMHLNASLKNIELLITFDVEDVTVNDFRKHLKTYYLSNEYVPFVKIIESQTGITGIDEGLELTLFYE